MTAYPKKPGFVAKVQQTTSRDMVYEQLKRLILTNGLQAGEIILIDKVAKELGVSNTPVREALGLLQADGLVVMKKHRSTRVALFSERDLCETYEARILLEGWAVEKIGTTPIKDRLEPLAARLEAAFEQAQRGFCDLYLEADARLHEFLVNSAGNELVAHLYGQLNNHYLRARTLTHYPSMKHLGCIHAEHQKIITALERQDAEGAKTSLRVHLENAFQRSLAIHQELGEKIMSES